MVRPKGEGKRGRDETCFLVSIYIYIYIYRHGVGGGKSKTRTVSRHPTCTSTGHAIIDTDTGEHFITRHLQRTPRSTHKSRFGRGWGWEVDGENGDRGDWDRVPGECPGPLRIVFLTGEGSQYSTLTKMKVRRTLHCHES